MTCPDADKIAYPTEKAARRALKQIKRHRRDGGGFIHVYRCGGHFHLGHGHKTTPPTKSGRKFR